MANKVEPREPFITIYLLRYDLDGRRVWYNESMDREKAIRMRNYLRRMGCNPRLKRVVVSPQQLLGSRAATSQN